MIFFSIQIIILFAAGYVVFKLLGIGNFIGNAVVDRVTEVQDNIDLQTYNRQQHGNKEPHERVITDYETNEIKKRIEKRKNKEN